MGSVLACLGKDKSADLIRTILSSAPIEKENYYRNVLTLFGLGFDEGYFAFDEDGRVYFPGKK